MATDDLPNEFDIIIAGTGLTETIVAAAFSRIGLKVLHLDRNDYYGGAFANFNLQAIEAWKDKNESLVGQVETSHEPGAIANIENLLKEGEQVIALPPEPAHAFNIKTQFHVRERTAEEEIVAEARKSKSRFQFSSHNFPQVQDTEQTANKSDSKDESKDIQTFDLENPEEKCEVDKTSETVPGEIEQMEGNRLAKEQGDSDPGDGSENVVSFSGLKESDGNNEKQAENLPGAAGDSPCVAASKSGAETITDDIAEESESDKSQEWTVGDIKDEWRKFCFDISPKVLSSCGDTVELLIQSDVARYCEFRSISRVLTLLNDILQQVPCSRADVFTSKIVSLIEKRLIMRFFQFAADYEKHLDEYKDYKGKRFVDFLKAKRLTPTIQHFVQHAVAMVTDTTTTEEGLKATQAFLRSLGRYGNTPFLFPLYGTGELPQAFARLSAVFGGVYCLQMSPTHIVADGDNKCCGIIASNGQLIRCKYLIAENSYLPPSYVWTLSNSKTSRAICITDSSILPPADSELSLLNFVSKDDPARPVLLLELPPSACVCPQNLFVVHLTRTAAHDNAEEDFSEVTEKLFACDASGETGNKPKILWSMFFTLEDKSQVTISDTAVTNVLVTSGGGDFGIDLDFCIQEAKCIFHTVCPDEEFLPKPPNPEDIIHVDDNEAAVATGPSEFEAKGSEEGHGDKGKETESNEELSLENEEIVDTVQNLVEKINLETGEAGTGLSDDG